MIDDYSRPWWDPRFAELDNLIAEQDRKEKKNKNLVTDSDAEHTELQIEHIARVKREIGARARVKKKLLTRGGSPEIAWTRRGRRKAGAEAKNDLLVPGGNPEIAHIRRI
jgi:hypothetical protein